MKGKLPLLILLVFLIGTGIIAYKFYDDSQKLSAQNAALEGEKSRLEQEKSELTQKYNSVLKKHTALNDKNKTIQNALDKAESEKSDLKRKYDDILQERDLLVQKIKDLSTKQTQTAAKPQPSATTRSAYTETPTPSSGDYWADVVREKAELLAKLENLQSDLLETKTKIAQYQKENKELSLRIDELTKTEERLSMEMAFKERTMQIMSRDLVSEREARKKIAGELDKLRNENVELKREVIVANKEKIDLQNSLKGAIQTKSSLEKTVTQVESILKEKSMMFSDLENRLTKAVSKDVSLTGKESTSVELPPIVVQPDTSVKALRGEVLAVNNNDNFVIIDLGADRGVKPGSRFAVVRGENSVGTIEIIETRKEISAADIKESFSGYSIREGDTVLLQ